MLSADVLAGFGAGLDELPVALRSVRTRQLDLCRRLADDDWGRQSRCHLWTVHDVVRHVRDGCRLHVEWLRTGVSSLHREGPFDARKTPLRWLERTASQAPDETMAELADLCAQEATALDARLARGGDERTDAPYGPAHWTILTAHVFWDAWIHHRDVTQPLGVDHTWSPVEDGMMALYALLIASIPAARLNHPLDVTVELTAGDGHAYQASVRPAQVVVDPEDGFYQATLRGELVAVVDSLAGRGPEPDAVLHGDPAACEVLSWMRSRLLPES
jgi:uncharacterized protein (TIGR03083 family)